MWKDLITLIIALLARLIGNKSQPTTEIRKQRHETEIKARPAGDYKSTVDSLPE